MQMRRSFSHLAAALIVGVTLFSTASSARQDTASTRVTAITAAEFFSAAKVWTAHLTLTAEAWAAMQPRYGSSSGGGSRFLGPAGGRNGVAARQGIEFDYVQGTLQLGDWTFRNVALRFKGNGSFLRATRGGGDKISLKVDLNKYVKGQKLAGLTTLNFQNNVTDPGWMNEVLAYRLYRDAGALAPRTTYAQVHLTVEGEGGTRFLGLYSVSENVDEAFFEERFGTRKGAILKPSTQDLFTDWGPDWNAYQQSYDPKTDLTYLLWQNYLDCVRKGEQGTLSTPELGAAAFSTVNMGVLSYRHDQVLYWDKEQRKPVPGNATWAAQWEKRSKERGKPNQITGWRGGEAGSNLKPPEYMKLAGPWTDGKDPAGE